VLGRQALAAARPAIGDHLAAANGRHAGAETVPAGTNDLAGLKSTLHGFSPLANVENF
jgi:hypothetical protein